MQCVLSVCALNTLPVDLHAHIHGNLHATLKMKVKKQPATYPITDQRVILIKNGCDPIQSVLINGLKEPCAPTVQQLDIFPFV
jgi:hypothetical protein